MAKPPRRKKKRKPRKRAAEDDADAQPSQSSGARPAERDGPSEDEPARPARPKRKARRAKPSEAAASSKSAASSNPEPSSKPTGARGRPYWLLAAIGGVVAIVAYQQMTQGSSSDSGTTEVPIAGAPSGPERLRVSVHERYPHDEEAFTQGLLWHDGHLYESTGLRGESSLRIVDLRSGRVLQSRANEDRIFAEGLARIGDELFQLSWQAGEAHVWTVNNFDHQRTLDYEGEGWGLCHDGRLLVMSDGSERLAFRDPVTFQIDHVVRVRDGDGPVRHLNELECVDGVIWANVWQTDRIVRIDPRSGRVTGDVDASGLLSRTERWTADVLNGIAWVPERERFLLTGKHWPWVFEVEFVPVLEGEDEDE